MIVQTTPSGVPMAVRLVASRGRGAEPSPQLTSTIPVPVVKSATVGALVGVDEGAEQDGAGRRCPRFP